MNRPAENQPSPARPAEVLFVCTGNTCRSPMAAALFTQRCRARGLSGMRGVSAGVAAVPGRSMTREASLALAEAGIPMPTGRSRPVTAALIDRAVLVVAMTRDHAEELRDRFPEAAGKIETLGNLAGAGRDILDPYGGSLEVYRRCLADMKQGLDRLVEQLANSPHGEKQ